MQQYAAKGQPIVVDGSIPVPSSLVDELRATPNLDVLRDVPLKSLGRWRIGGNADLVVRPHDKASLAKALSLVESAGVARLIVGDGSNLLYDGAGFRGVVINVGRTLSGLKIDGNRVTALSGTWVPDFAHRVGRAGLSGAEHTIGIPGTIGGLVVMNGGSQRRSIGESVVQVTCLDNRGMQRVFNKEECAFAYRRSNLQSGDYTVVEVDLEFAYGDRNTILRDMIAIMADRRRKFPLKIPNCGSVFVSDPIMYDTVGPPGKAIQSVGLRGHRIGGAQIAEDHGNFILNINEATSQDILQLIKLSRESVYQSTGFWMDCEVRYVSPQGHIMPAHQAG